MSNFEATEKTESLVRKSLGKNIARFRKYKKISQRDFAEKIGIGYTNLSNIENGKYAPRLNTLIKMAVVLDTPLYEFFIFHSHISASAIRRELMKASGKDEAKLRLIYKIYVAVNSDFSAIFEE